MALNTEIECIQINKISGKASNSTWIYPAFINNIDKIVWIDNSWACDNIAQASNYNVNNSISRI